MLDIVVPVHLPNFPLVVRREIEVSELGEEEESFSGMLPELIKGIDVPFRVVISAEGGGRSDLAAIESYLTDFGDWQILHNDGVTSYEVALHNAVQVVKNPLVAVVPPWYLLCDQKWIGKMQKIFLVDGRAMLVSTLDEPGSSSTVPPAKFDHHHHPCGQMFLTKRVALQDFAPPPCKDWLTVYSKNIHNGGGTRWEHPGLGFTRLDHTPHERSLGQKTESVW